MNENRKLTNSERKAKKAAKRAEKRAMNKERNRRASTKIIQHLNMNRDEVLKVLDEYKIDRVTLEEIINWQSIPEIAPEHGTKILKVSKEIAENKIIEEERNKMRAEKKKIAAEKRHEETLASLTVKLKNKRPKLFSYEEEQLEEDGFYLAKGIVGRKPSEVVESYKDDEYAQLVAKYFKIDFNDHRTYPAHMGNCDMDGKEDSCEDRIQQQKEHVKEQRRLEAGMKEISIMTSDVQKGDYVKFYYDSKIGIVKKVNKVSYTVEGIGSSKDLGLLKNYRTNPEWLKKIDLKDYLSYEVSDEVMVHCLDGHNRLSKIVEKRDNCFYLVEYCVKSKNTNMHCWIDCSRFVE